MKTLSLPVLAILLFMFGAAMLFAGPEEELAPTLGLTSEVEVGPEQVEALVRALAEKPTWQVQVDATFLRIDAERADEILGLHRPKKLGSARVIPAQLARELVNQACGQGAVRPEPLPPLVLYTGQTGRLSATGRHTYLQDYDVEPRGMGSTIGSPIVGRLEDGTHLDVTPRREDEALFLDLDAVWVEVLRPIPLFETSLPSMKEKVTIELPELRILQVKKQVELPAAGGYVLAGGGREWDGETLRLVVIQISKTAR